jgi:hypothetical protein
MLKQALTDLSSFTDIAWGMRNLPLASLRKYEPIHTRESKFF